jgi:hypothetical protein
MRVLIACEFSGIVRDAFRARGHDAWSCDIETAEPSKSGLGHIYHIQGDVTRVLDGSIPMGMIADSNWRDTPIFRQWDLLIAHPPCTYLCNSGVRWLYGGKGLVPDETRMSSFRDAAAFFVKLQRCNIPRIAIENPIPHKRAKQWAGNYSQIIQPWMFGHGETKATCLWLKNLPKLEPTKIVEGRTPRVHRASPGPDRWKERSRTLQGIADAMAEQWGSL